jgi:hypothetical protein
MLPYWLLFLVPAYLALSRLRPIPQTALSVRRDRWPNEWRGMFFIFVLMIGLRHEVGADWYTYILQLEYWVQNPFHNIFNRDFSYSLLEWIGVNIAGGIYFVNLICAVFFTWGVFSFCLEQPRPSLALVVAVPVFIIIASMGYTRQGVAIAIAMRGFLALGQSNSLRFLFYIALAATFHESSLILVPLVVLVNKQKRIFTLLLIGLALLIMSFWLLGDRFGIWSNYYFGTRMESTGALMRVVLNAVPAALFLVFRKRFQLSPGQRAFWTWMAWGALLLVVALKILPSSTVVDRVALYWIPLQMFVLSRLPNALGRRDGKNALWVCGIVAYSAAILFVWLFFGVYSEYWLPYQFYPWVWLWQ